jgi:regulatory protein
VEQKLKSLKMNAEQASVMISHLINDNFLNESRFSCSFTREKHHMNHWDSVRIVNELKFRNSSAYSITLALKEVLQEEYTATFDTVSERQWETIRETNNLGLLAVIT